LEHELLDRLRRTAKPIVLSGAGIVGEAVLELCRAQGIEIAGVCDGSTKVAGTRFHGFEVIHTTRLRERYGDTLVLISVAAIKDVVDLLRCQGFDDWVAAGPLLESQAGGLDSATDARAFAVETCILCHAGYLYPEKAFLRSVDLIITERCSLKCKDCANLMQYYDRPQNVPTELLFHSIDTLCGALDEIMELRIIGGDAFMNKDWPQIAARALATDKIKRVVVYTNGTIVPKAEHAQLLRHPKVITVVTDYGPLSRDLARLKTYFAEHGVAHRILQVDSWLDCARIERRDRQAADKERIYRECCAKNMLSLSEGRLFRCPFAANADRLAAVPDVADDYVDIHAAIPGGSAELRRRIMDYALRDRPLGTCDYCSGRPLAGTEVAPAVQVAAALPYRRYPRATP
jgi:Radical SAM superfamily